MTTTDEILTRTTDQLLDAVDSIAAATRAVRSGTSSGEELARVLADASQACDALRCWQFRVQGPRPADPSPTPARSLTLEAGR